jgi:fermentation-respiration switch protein FrsA (DUF1100 family)
MIVLVVLGTMLLLLVGASFYFYQVAFYRQEKTFLLNNPDLVDTTRSTDLPVLEISWVERQRFESIEMMSYDGLRLRGYYLKAKEPTRKTVILAHGYGGTARTNMGGLAELYHETFGFNVFMPDHRGHGKSEGAYIGFGWHDRLDYLKWIGLILQRDEQDAEIVLHGISMGGSTVLMTAGETLPKQVKCIIEDCGYTSLNEILAYQAKRMYRLPAFPFVPLTGLVCKLRAGFFPGEASALKQVARATRPILFMHGGADTFVPTEMVYRLYEASKGYKELFLVPKAGHGMAFVVDQVGYTRKVKDFLRKFMG